MYTLKPIKVDLLKVDLVKRRSHHENGAFHQRKRLRHVSHAKTYFYSKKTPAVRLTRKNVIFQQKSACGKPHTQKPRLSTKKAPAATLTRKNTIVLIKKI